jgi:hypothetical protein
MLCVELVAASAVSAHSNRWDVENCKQGILKSYLKFEFSFTRPFKYLYEESFFFFTSLINLLKGLQFLKLVLFAVLNSI